MKQLKRYLLAAFIAASLVFTACNKDTAKPAEETKVEEKADQAKTDEKTDEKKDEKADQKEEKTEEEKKKEEEERMAKRTQYIEQTKNAYSEEYTELEHGDNPEVGQASVDFTVKTVDGSDQEVKLDQILASGELVHLNFFTTSCRFCVGEMPDLVEENARDDVKVVAIGVGEKPITLKRFAEGQQLNLPIFSDESREAGNGYLVSGVPVHYYIKDGKIVGKMNGAWNKAVLNYVVDELNAGNPMPDEAKLQEVYEQGEAK